jgi:RHH-type transcriptional regulator, proline utilization regulon repressor / proline dehydrogenase / delta 1-pyrroline-5-carboxylate dehydrogenase
MNNQNHGDSVMKNNQHQEIIREAIVLAKKWQERANALLTAEERGIQEQMMRLLTHPLDKVILTKMIDQSFRSENTHRVADQINYLLRNSGVPEFFSSVEKLLVQMFLSIGRHIPNLAVPKMIDKMRHDSSRAIIPGEPDVLHDHLRKRKQQGVRMNINHLGEAVLGEAEATYRLETYIQDLQNPEIEYISVKISTIYSQIHALAFEHTISILKERLSLLYRTAAKNRFVRKDGTEVPKFVNLDMEEYRDLAITANAFTETLDQPEFRNHSAGIVLQAYLPDSFPMQKQLTHWAMHRVGQGGSPIKIRIVKGANMEMEMVESALQNWPLATYDQKLHVDANYKRMVEYGMELDHIRAVHLGIASHNLFELAYACKVAEKNGVREYLSFEMLEGMADHVRRAICETGEEMVLYAPVATREQFISAIAYLIRRLDENTAEDNFLRYSPSLKPGSEEWRFLEKQFVDSCEAINEAPMGPNRIQNRKTEIFSSTIGTFYQHHFVNEPDTDWCMPGNREWADEIRDQWKKSPKDSPLVIPIVVEGEEILTDRDIRECIDPSQLPEKICVARFALAGIQDAEKAIATAKNDPDHWRSFTPKERHEILSRVAMRLRESRKDLVGSAMAGTGKIITEADAEVSEAIDFAEYYPFSAETFSRLEGVECRGKGVSLVLSPWNFPIAIPCGGIIAGLAAGNTVIFKPSSEAVLPAWILCQCFWKAGVSRNTLQFLPCSGSEAGARLTGHPDIQTVILTGGTETGLRILKHRPNLDLAAETGGKNATIVTAMSDRDQAIKNVVYSAFGNCGQKCSATSLLILEKEVYEDDSFAKQLADAARSYHVGSVWDFKNKIGPLIHRPGEDLHNALTRLDEGEHWLLAPANIQNNPLMWTPGIKWGVKPGSYTHHTEFFGPVLGVMCAEDLDQAITLVNQTGYGLTSGLESLDQREHEIWKSRIEAGNLYINRGTTGAIVLRQPFGGMKKSALGAGIKAGGPNYVSQFMDFRETGNPLIGAIRGEYSLQRLANSWQRETSWGKFPDLKEDLQKTAMAIESYLYWMEEEFGQVKDYFHLRGQDNQVKYLPVGTVMVRLHEKDSLFDTLARIAAVQISGCKWMISIPRGMNNSVTCFLNDHEGRKLTGDKPFMYQTDQDLADSLKTIQRIRYAAPERVPDIVFQAAAKTGFYIARRPVLMEGRIELLHYFREQSICDNYHRYGNLGERAVLNK